MENTGKRDGGWRGHVLPPSGSFLQVVLGKGCSQVEVKAFCTRCTKGEIAVFREGWLHVHKGRQGGGQGLGTQDAQLYRTAMPGFAWEDHGSAYLFNGSH